MTITVPPLVKKYGGIAIIGLLLWFQDGIVGIFQTGVAEERKDEVKTIVNTPDVIQSIFANEETKRLINVIKKQGEDEMIKRDADKVGLRVLLSKEMNVFEDNVPPELGSNYKWVNWFKSKMDSIIDYKVEKRVKIIRKTHNLSRI